MWRRDEVRTDRAETHKPTHGVAPGAAAPAGTPVPESRIAKLGSSVIVKGELTGSEDLTVDGRVEGKIDLPDHTLTIGPNADIRANIVAKTVTVFGNVVGDISARHSIDIRRGGSLVGQLACARIAIQDGAQFSGRV